MISGTISRSTSDDLSEMPEAISLCNMQGMDSIGNDALTKTFQKVLALTINVLLPL